MLVAISIPVFNGQLERSRDAVTVANLRAAYAEAMTDMLTDGTTTSTKPVVCKGHSADCDLSGQAGNLPFKDGASDGAIAYIAGLTSESTVDVIFTIDSNNEVKATK